MCFTTGASTISYTLVYPNVFYYVTTLNCLRVIPCQINQEFRVTSQILTKLGVFVVPVVLITHANF